MANNPDFLLFYSLLEDLTPLRGDCGRICGGACCSEKAASPDPEFPEEKTGMLLFPGEEALLGDVPGFQILSARGMDGQEERLLLCGGTCDRSLRPLACRLFPLFPHVDKTGRVRAIYDPRSYRLCPLTKLHGHVRLEKSFVRTVRRIGRLLMQDPDCRDFLLRQSAEIDEITPFLHLEEGRSPICRIPPNERLTRFG